MSVQFQRCSARGFRYEFKNYCSYLGAKNVGKGKSHANTIAAYFKSNKHLQKIKKCIPEQYFSLKIASPDNLYLICPETAKVIVSHVWETIKSNPNQIISETNAGLGIITAELLDRGVPLVRLYECCPEFRTALKDLDKLYCGRVELFTRDIYHLHRYSYLDRFDNAHRVQQLLRNIPKKSWSDDPVLTIIGAMSSNNFLKHLVHTFVMQTELTTFGRIQLFAMMKPSHYAVLSAGPHNNLLTYQPWSVLFNLFLEFKRLEKISRKQFLPWESPKNTSIQCADSNADYMYLVQINFKKDLPLPAENLLPFFYFVKQIYGRGSGKIIPTVEKWIPDCGLHILVPQLRHSSNIDYFKDMNIWTKFRDLSPLQILGIFREVVNYPTYNGSPFMEMIEGHLVKHETIETSLADSINLHEKTIVDDIEIKFGLK